MLSTMSRCADYFWNFQNGHRCHGNDQNAKNLKNTKMISRLLAKQKLIKLVRKNIHIQWNEISQKKSESIGQTLSQLPQKQKKGGLKKILIPFIKLHETFVRISTQCVAAFGGLKKIKMVTVAMVTKVQKMLNSNRTVDPFET